MSERMTTNTFSDVPIVSTNVDNLLVKSQQVTTPNVTRRKEKIKDLARR